MRPMVQNAYTKLTTMPATAAATTPNQGSPVKYPTRKPTRAPMAIRPSRPILTMPARSEKSSPSVTKTNGVAMRTVVTITAGSRRTIASMFYTSAF